ncbi:MAG TPA: helix-turn-helix transcriptional regulator [Chitinophagales bacterium]|nr:helix-turn-helix transcriptional regulator [Chitinophagales bacterium]
MKPLNYYKKPRKSYKPLFALYHRSIFGGMKVHENIRALRMAKGLTQEFMAKKLKMDVANYSRIERGVAKLTVERLQEIAEILNTGINELVHLNIQNTLGSASSEDARMQELLKQNNALLEGIREELRRMRDTDNEK